MPKVGMEPIRRQALISAAIEAIHARGSFEVTMSEIARQAGVSTALAHHYFGSKDQLIVATMRHLLDELNGEIVAALRTARTPRERITGIIRANFGSDQFRPATISAWLTFYVKAQSMGGARRVLSIYARRLRSNLRHALSQLTDKESAKRIAEGTAAMIDGLYLRHALLDSDPDREAAIRLTEDYIDAQLAAGTS
ncbi:transcriptional regulator BetI [Nisaea acidiphila]|uniref:HTH-type transcriptional regulator BetI n=1 Tax=Nisaea acidiphila TaxID=1862145 RepID=A0A9J7ASI1_9PROT|nr:transcriptional regulator BetI [Nisaea acidiphila]UUX50619.1 transcriptional regulator BetI [Nisaea acidiphila]